LKGAACLPDADETGMNRRVKAAAAAIFLALWFL
jgi:hypothetical protein